jgi:hypothetical protein
MQDGKASAGRLVFISYRRVDSAGHAGRLHDFLAQRYGAARVFMDIADIQPGEDFRAAVAKVLGGCRVVVALMGPRWLTDRLHRVEDMVRVELRDALARPELRVIPALVAGAVMPQEAELPVELAPLASRNAVELSEARWAQDCHALCQTIDEVLGPTAEGDAEAPVAPDPYQRLSEEARAWGLPLVTPIGIEFSADWLREDMLEGEELSLVWKLSLSCLRSRLETAFGMRVFGVRIMLDKTGLPEGTYVILINEVRLVSGFLPTGQRLCLLPSAQLAAAGIPAMQGKNPLGHGPPTFVEPQHWAAAQAKGFELLSRTDCVFRHLERLIRFNLSEFLGVQEVHDLLAADAPAVLEQVHAQGELPAVHAVMAGLLDEQLPVQAPGRIAQTVLEELAAGGHVLDALARVRMLPSARDRLAELAAGAQLYRLPAAMEKKVAAATLSTPDCALLGLSPERVHAVNEGLKSHIAAGTNAVLGVEDALTRRMVRLLVALEHQDLPVLAGQELPPALRTRPRRLVRC